MYNQYEFMKMGGGIKKKELITQAIAVRLPVSQLLYQHQFQYGGVFTICSLPQIAPC